VPPDTVVIQQVDQYVAVQKADRPIYKGHGSPSKGHVTKPKPFGATGHSNSSGGFQKSTLTGYNAKPHTEQKPSATTAGNKFTTQRDRERALGVCFYCKKQGHILPSCPLLRAEREQKEAPVHLVSTVSSQVTQGQVSSTVVQ